MAEVAAVPGAGRGVWGRLHELVFGPVDPIRLRAFRSLFALALLFYVCERAATPLEWLTAEGFHPSPGAHFPHEQPVLPPLPVWLVPPFLALFGASLVALVLGWRARLATWAAFAGTAVVTQVDLASAFTINKLSLFGLVVLGLAPAARRVDGVERTTAWPVRVLQATLLIQYGTAGWCKVLQGDWLELGFHHGQWALHPDVLWSQVQGLYRTGIAAWLLRTQPLWAWTAMQYSALAFELLAPVLFLFRRTRVLAMLWGVGFQSMIALTMYKLFYFSFQMLTFYVLFLDPELLRRLARKLPGRGRRR